MTDAWEMHQAETGLNPGPVWRDRGVIINTLTERNQALEERVAELEGSCQKLRDDYQGALAEKNALRARIGKVAQRLIDEAHGRPVAQRSFYLAASPMVDATLASPAVDTTPEPTPADDDQHLHHKYDVRKINDPTGKHRDCRFFVLDPRHDQFASAALFAYAQEARRDGNESLAADVQSLIGYEESEDTTPSEQQAQGEDYPDAEGLAVLRDNEAPHDPR